MRIIVQSESKNLNLYIPTRLAFNRLTAVIGAKIIQKHTPQEGDSENAVPFWDAKHLILLEKEINRAHRLHGNMLLVDVESTGGQKVQIYL